MSNKLFDFFIASDDTLLENKFYKAVDSSYFSRLIVSWVLWNWKIFFITFFVNDYLVKSHINGLQISRVAWVMEEYSEFWHRVIFVVLGPAFTAWFVFIFFEFFNILSFYISKLSWKFRTKIERFFNKSTLASNKMVEDYLQENNTNKLKLNQLTNDFQDQIQTNQKLLKTNNACKNENLELVKEIAMLKLKDMEERDKARSTFFKEEAQKIIEQINQAKNKEKILAEFKLIYRKIKVHNGRCEIVNPSQILGSLVTMKLFILDEKTSEYSISKIGEYFNELLILQ